MDGLERWIPPLRAGRQPAGRALLSWLDDPRAPGLCRVSGPPGIGKSHLLGWLTAACSSPGTPAGQRPDAVLECTGLTVDGATWTLAGLLGMAARTPAELVAAVREDGRPRLLIVRHLDRAVEPGAVTTGLLAPLLALAGLRAVVEAATGTPEGDALAAAGPEAVLELDDPAWTDAGRFASWFRRLGGSSPFEAGQVYPSPGLARLAFRVAAQTDPFRAAAPAPDPSGSSAPATPATPTSPTTPTGDGPAAAWWAALPEDLRPAVALLAHTHRPLTRDEWTVLAGPDAVRRAADLLPPDSPAGDTWWLPAGPLRGAVTAASPEPDPQAVLRTLVSAMPSTAGGGPDLPAAGRGLLGLVLRQAVRVGTAGPLLDDPEFLAHADPAAVTAAFAALPGRLLADAWRAAGPALVGEQDAAVRAELLRTRLLGTAQAAPGPAPGRPRWRADWAYWPASDSPLVAAAVGEGRYAGRLLVADAKGAVRLVDLTTGQGLGSAPFTAPAQLRALACTPDGGVLALDATGMPMLLEGPAPMVLAGGGISALAGLPVVGDPAGRVHWLTPGRAVGERLHDGPVTAVGGVLPRPAGAADTGPPLLVSGGLDGAVRTWRPGLPPPAGPVDERPCPVVSVAVAALPGDPDGHVTAAAWTDGVVRVRRLDTAGGWVELRLGSPVTAVRLGRAGRVLVLLTDGVVCADVGVGPAPEPDPGSG